MPYLVGLIANGGSLTCSTSYQDIPNLTFTLAAGGTYRFEVHYLWQASATSTTLEPGMGGTCTATFLTFRSSIQVNNNSGSSSQVNNVLNNANAGPSTAAGQATTNYGVIINGLIVVNAAGTLTASCKHGTATATIQSGGRFILEQIA